MTSISAISVPEGMTILDMQKRDASRALALAKKEEEAAAVISKDSKGGAQTSTTTSTAVSDESGAGANSHEQARVANQDIRKKVSTSRVSWKVADARIQNLRKEAKESGEEYARVKKGYPKDVYAWKIPEQRLPGGRATRSRRKRHGNRVALDLEEMVVTQGAEERV